MRLAGRDWHTQISKVRLGRDTYRVISPRHPLTHASLYEGDYGIELSVDRAAAADLACAWWLAARSPRSLIHLPLRASTYPCGEEYGDRRLDLVLLHHSLAFPVSRWKAVRARLSPSVPHKVTLPENPFRTFSREERIRFTHKEFKDHLRWAVAADTLFLIGSRHAYELEGDEVRGVAEDAPARLAETERRHYCAELEVGRNKWPYEDHRNPATRLHLECCPDHW